MKFKYPFSSPAALKTKGGTHLEKEIQPAENQHTKPDGKKEGHVLLGQTI